MKGTDVLSSTFLQDRSKTVFKWYLPEKLTQPGLFIVPENERFDKITENAICSRQGVLLKRHRVPTGHRSGVDGEYWHWTHLNIGDTELMGQSIKSLT
jgi:hypothetical protein